MINKNNMSTEFYFPQKNGSEGEGTNGREAADLEQLKETVSPEQSVDSQKIGDFQESSEFKSPEAQVENISQSSGFGELYSVLLNEVSFLETSQGRQSALEAIESIEPVRIFVKQDDNLRRLAENDSETHQEVKSLLRRITRDSGLRKKVIKLVNQLIERKWRQLGGNN